MAEQMQMIQGAFENLTEAIRGMNVNGPPPPLAFNGKGNINDFFRVFENYCGHLYHEEHDSYLLALPNFLEGEAKNIVEAHGTGNNVTYELVKTKLVELFQKRSLGSSPHVRLWSATRHRNETFTCFAIRLQSLADKINISADDRKEMVKAKFMASVDSSLAKQLSIRFGDDDTVSITQLVNLATILEDSKPKQAINVASTWPTVEVDTSVEPVAELDAMQVGAIGGHTGFAPNKMRQPQGTMAKPHGARPSQPDKSKREIVCYGCKESGHFRSECPNITCGKCQRKGHEASRCRTGTGSNTPVQSRGMSATCTFCGKGQHVMIQCPEFRAQFLTCNWCGASEHKSHLCPTKPSGN